MVHYLKLFLGDLVIFLVIYSGSGILFGLIFMNKVNKSDHIKKAYTEFIKNFNFLTLKDINKKANLVFFKVIGLFVFLNLLTLSIWFVGSVFIGDKDHGVSEFLTSYIYPGVVLGVCAVQLLFAGLCRHWIKQSQRNMMLDDQLERCETDRILFLSQQFPQLGTLVKKRILDQGFLSQLDYQTLCINQVFCDLRKTR